MMWQSALFCPRNNKNGLTFPLNLQSRGNKRSYICLQYTAMVEVYYKFAYYTCCIPYKFSLGNAEKYRLTEWWPQKVSFKRL